MDNHVNLLVGINGSGKSNFIKAFQLLKAGVEGNSDDNALFKLLIEQWGGFDNIFCSSTSSSNYENSIGLEFCLNGSLLSQNVPIDFKENIVYKIVIIKKRSEDNYVVSEKICTVEGQYVYLDVYAGSGKISERIAPGNGASKTGLVDIDGYNPRELVLSKISSLDRDKYLPLLIIKEALRGIFVYNHFDTTSDSKMRRAVSAANTMKNLLPDGSNLPQILNRIKLQYKPEFREAQKMLEDVNENFSGVDFNVLGGGFIELYLDEKHLNRSVHVAHVSDGTLRFLCLLAILFNPERGRFICIEEPETGLHPDMIFNITSQIKKASAQTTFVISTHNPSVLNAFKIEQIRVFEKDESNETKVYTYSEKDFAGWYDEFNPGVMWRAGDLGGKRW